MRLTQHAQHFDLPLPQQPRRRTSHMRPHMRLHPGSSLLRNRAEVLKPIPPVPFSGWSASVFEPFPHSHSNADAEPLSRAGLPRQVPTGALRILDSPCFAPP